MKKLHILGFILGGMGLLCLGDRAFSEEAANVRALFMSTAGSIVDTSSEKSKEAQKTQVKTAKKNSTSKIATKYSIPAGLEVRAVKVLEDGREIPIDLKKNALKSGEKFVIYFRTNLPGYVQIVNVTPDKRLNRLGVWQVPEFAEVKFPPEGEFTLAGVKGREKLMMVFYPCNPSMNSERQVAYTRDIVVVNNRDNNLRVSNEISQNLPICFYEGEKIVYQNYQRIYAVETRDIILSSSSRHNVMSSYEDGRNYYISRVSNKKISPLVVELEILHK